MNNDVSEQTQNQRGRYLREVQNLFQRRGKDLQSVASHGSARKWEVRTPVEDQPQRQQWNDRSELERRPLAQVCEQCGATRLTETLEVHHIRALRDLNRYKGREKHWFSAGPVTKISIQDDHSNTNDLVHGQGLPDDPGKPGAKKLWTWPGKMETRNLDAKDY